MVPGSCEVSVSYSGVVRFGDTGVKYYCGLSGLSVREQCLCLILDAILSEYCIIEPNEANVSTVDLSWHTHHYGNPS